MANAGTTVVVISAFAFVFGKQVAAEVLDPGKAEYHSSCASCHGIDGKGNGPVSADLKVPPSDLTVLARKNAILRRLRDHRWTKSRDSSRDARHADLR